MGWGRGHDLPTLIEELLAAKGVWYSVFLRAWPLVTWQWSSVWSHTQEFLDRTIWIWWIIWKKGRKNKRKKEGRKWEREREREREKNEKKSWGRIVACRVYLRGFRRRSICTKYIAYIYKILKELINNYFCVNYCYDNNLMPDKCFQHHKQCDHKL